MKAWVNQYSLCIHCTVQSCLSADSMAAHTSVKNSKSWMGKMYICRKQYKKIVCFGLSSFPPSIFHFLHYPEYSYSTLFTYLTVSMYLTVCFLITLNIEHLSLISGRKIHSLITQIAWKSPRVLQSDVQGCSGSNSSKKILVGRFLWIISICYLVLTWSIPSKPSDFRLALNCTPQVKSYWGRGLIQAWKFRVKNDWT